MEPPNSGVVVEVGGGDPKGLPWEDEVDEVDEEDEEDEEGGAPNREAAPPAGVRAPNRSVIFVRVQTCCPPRRVLRSRTNTGE